MVSRRRFLLSSGALLIGARGAFCQTPAADKNEWQPVVYLGIEQDGTVLVIVPRSEMGTGIRTTLAMVASDELDADWTRVRVQQANGDDKYGSQDTEGSASARDFYSVFRKAGATARTMLQHAAAQQWGVPITQCTARNHAIVDTNTGLSLGFAELIPSAAKQPIPKEDALVFKTPDEWKYVGKSVPITDQDDICKGRAIYGQDVMAPDMLYACIERCPVIGGKLKTSDDSEAKQVPGVQQIVVVDPPQPPYISKALGGVAVLGNNTWAALQGRKKLKIEWDLGENASYNSVAYRAELEESAKTPQQPCRNRGDVEAVFAKALKIIEASYYTPHLAHAPMEPPAAVASFNEGRVEIWASTQDPQRVQETVARALRIRYRNVVCHVTLLGSAFGRKSMADFAAEAAILSRRAGKPVKIVWTREDDIRFDYYQPPAAMYLKAAVDEHGRPSAWLQRSVFPSVASTFALGVQHAGLEELGQGWMDIPFDIPNIRVENAPAKNHVRIGYTRSAANLYHGFAVQSFVDELAAAARRDRVEYMLDLIGPPRHIDLAAEGVSYPNYGKSIRIFPFDTGRLRRVIEIAAEQSGWARKKPSKGHGFGIAAHRSFLSYVAAVVEVSIDSRGNLRIPRIDIAADCGQVIHPDRVQAQFEGAAVFGAGAALFGEITAENGAIRQSNFNDYPVARMPDAPLETHVHLVQSTEPPAGAGEPGVPPIAPALCSAIYAATGKRIRNLPIRETQLI